MDLRDIEYFAIVARHGHLGRAAEALGLGQPALSMSLRRLEQSAQAKLVERTPKGVVLTSVGTALLSHVEKLRLARDDLAREVADIAQGRAGQLRIGASPSNAEALLPEACSALLRAMPKAIVHISVLDNDALLPALRKGELDLAFTHTRQSRQADVSLEFLRQDEFIVYCAGNHRLARRKAVALEDLAQERWACAASATGDFGPLQVLSRAFEARGLPPPRIALVSDLVMFKVRAVADSDLVGIAVRANLDAAARLRVKILPVRGLDWTRPVAVAYRRNAYLPPAARRFIAIAKTLHAGPQIAAARSG